MITLLVGGEDDAGADTDAAAAAVAAELGRELHRVDLGAVTGRYIGETEKNLSALLRKARESGWVLLFDEADALFGRRTEVKDGHDRFARSPASAVLGRLEADEDVVLLAARPRRRVFGKHRGTCVSTDDPLQAGRIQVTVPDVVEAAWAMPCVPFGAPGVPTSALPPVEAGVWVEFEGGDPALPIWAGGFWEPGDGPSTAP